MRIRPSWQLRLRGISDYTHCDLWLAWLKLADLNYAHGCEEHQDCGGDAG